MYDWLDKAVDDGATIVTASRRLARALRQCHADRRQAGGEQSWLSPRILSWQAWMHALLDDVHPLTAIPVRIDGTCSTILWERCLAAEFPQPPQGFPELVRMVRPAWQRLQDWRVPAAELSRFARSPDERLFAVAALRYREELRGRDLIDDAGVPQLVLQLLQSGAVQAPPRLMLAGFDRVAPIVEAIAAAAAAAGSIVRHADPRPRGTAAVGVPCNERHNELRAAGCWARSRLEEHAGARVAIIVPDLQRDAQSALRHVREGLAPGWQYAGEAARLAVDVSLGRRLSEYPAIAVALMVLRWVHGSLSSRELSIVLRSPYIGTVARGARSRFDLALRRWPDRAWTPARLVAALRKRDPDAEGERWLHAVERLSALRAATRGTASPARRAETIDRALADFGWPGESLRDSEGFQLHARWRALLGEFAATGIVTPQTGFAAAVQRLAGMAREVIHQAEGAPGIVPMLGMLECAGLEFDAVWVCGLDATRWPPPPHPLTLVSRRLQEHYGMPDATPQDSLRFARRVLQHILGSARQAVLSWSLRQEDAELAPSPLLDELGLGRAEEFRDPGRYAASLVGAQSLERVPSDAAPQAAAGETIAGGAYTVQRQTVDPFAAFARGRLGIGELRQFETGLSQRLRGTLLHAALRALFAPLPTRDELRAWLATDLDARLRAAVASAAALRARHLDRVHRRLLRLESRRLVALLRRFIAAEAERRTFAVAGVEVRLPFERHGLHLTLRADRIDRLPDGSLLIIDYKSGAPRNLLNQDGDPRELQLLMYASAVQEPVGGLALINIDSREISYKGAGGGVEWDTDGKDEWPQRLARWMRRVDEALQQIAAGDARVNIGLQPADARPHALLSRIEELRHER